jgi:hypothetical protein
MIGYCMLAMQIYIPAYDSLALLEDCAFVCWVGLGWVVAEDDRLVTRG